MSTDVPQILVIDDDPVSRELLLLLLKRQGHQVTTADSGGHALQLLKEHDTAIPQVILADLQMPGISGAKLADALRETCGDTPILIAMSASSPDQAASRGYDAFLLKPFTIDEFAALTVGYRSVHSPAEQPTSHEASILDHAIYQKLSDAMKPEQLKKLFTLCLEDVKKRISTMHTAAADGDDASYRREAHAIKGGSGMVGATELQRLASTMEINGLAANHVATLTEIVLACERLERMLNARKAATV